MVDKLPCLDCGVLILQQTAKDHSGKCVPCARGYRQNIEASRRRSAKRTYDPHDGLWKSLVDRVHATALGYKGLTDDERLYYAVTSLNGHVWNGGLSDFFQNESNELREEAIAGLVELGAMDARTIVIQASHATFGETVPIDKDRRWELVEALMEEDPMSEAGIRLEQLNQAYLASLEEIHDKLRSFAEERKLLDPFLQKASH